MKSIGIDIGTTTICGILFDDETNTILETKTLSNNSMLPSNHSYETLQDPIKILSICNEILSNFYDHYTSIGSIGVTGQMHGILYIDADGNPTTPLYTWQDQRGNLPYVDHMTYTEYIHHKTNEIVATGFGMVTYFYHHTHNLIPKTSTTFCTIPDFIAMKLARQTTPFLHSSMATSLGLYSLTKQQFNQNAIENLNLNSSFLPMISQHECILGTTTTGIPVSIALGDNQASFFGSVDQKSNLLVNVGTGSQISIFYEQLPPKSPLEPRPYIGNTYLLTGSSLCGGYAYSLLKNFLEETLQAFGQTTTNSLYEQMIQLASSAYYESNKLIVDTRFSGTRHNPLLTGSITNITPSTFHPKHLILGTLQGICNELYEYYQHSKVSTNNTSFVGSGNGIRKNPLLQQIFSDTFQMDLKIPMYSEEAAFGSALFSIYCSKNFTSFHKIQEYIRYKRL